MNTKLTLSIEKEAIDAIKEYAKEKGQSVSDMVENYFKLLAHKSKIVEPEDLSPEIQRLRGIISLPKDYDVKKIVEEERSKKYNG